ncbi:MAG: hypothetical protein E7112_00370 [Bacteroidales bacterium]|nr:hypothetical protein [Bacteroidales bacterium]
MSNTFDFEAFKANAIEQLRAGFAFIAPEPISSTTVIQIVIQNFFSALDRILEIWLFRPKSQELYI